MTDPRQFARQIFDAGVTAADPAAAVAAHVHGLARPNRIVAVGKAAVQMARAALVAFPSVPTRVVTNYENAVELEGATVMAAGHPVPDENGAMAAQAVLADLRAAEGPVLALISGGGSALLPAPVEGVSLAEKAVLNSLLLGAGLDITQMNTVRQQVSQIKGGGMLQAAAPYAVTALILSDVVGDDLSTIASGPTAPPLGDAARLSVAAMQAAAPEAKVLSPVEGDVREAARMICDQAGPGVTLWGGETTVQLKGSGRGGRNQELALRIALEAQARGWTGWTRWAHGCSGRACG